MRHNQAPRAVSRVRDRLTRHHYSSTMVVLSAAAHHRTFNMMPSRENVSYSAENLTQTN